MPLNTLGAHDCEQYKQSESPYECPECGWVWVYVVETSTWTDPFMLRIQGVLDERTLARDAAIDRVGAEVIT